MDDNNKLGMVLSEPINFQGLKIYPPTIVEIYNYNIQKFFELLIPYSYSLELLGIEETENFKLLDVFFHKESLGLLAILIKSLGFFCKTEDVEINENSILVGDFTVDRNNFDELSEFILSANSKSKIKKEKEPIFKSERAKESYRKLQEGRARRQKQNELKLHDIINYVRYGGKYHISSYEIKNMTLFDLMNAYKIISHREAYDSNFSVFLVSGEKQLVEKHWSQEIKI